MVVRRHFLQIVASERKICSADGIAVFIDGQDFNQSICGNHTAISGSKFIGCIQSKGNSGHFALRTDAKEFIRFHDLVQGNFHFLTVVTEACGSFGNLNFLSCVDQFGCMHLGINDHAGRCGNFLDGELAEIQRLAGRDSIFTSGNGINYFTCRITKRSIQSVDIFGCGNFIDSARKTLYCVNGLIYALRCHHGREYFTGFGDLDDTFLRCIGFGDFNDGHTAFFIRSVLGYIEVHRLSVDNIAIRCLYFNQCISGTVFKSFGSNQITLIVGVESIDSGDFRISKGLRYQRTIGLVNLESSTRIRNGIAGFCVHFDNLNEGLKVGIVDEIAIDFAIRRNQHIEICNQFATFPTGNLVNGIDTVRHFLSLGKTMFITGEVITLGFLSCIIAACRFEIYAELCTLFGGFNLGFTIIGVLDDGNAALHYGFKHIYGGAVVLHSVMRCFCTYRVDRRIKQIALGGTDFTDSPVAAANVILSGKLTVCISGVAVDQFIAIVHAINCTCQGRVTLSGSGFGIRFGHGRVPLFQNVGKALVGYVVPFNRCALCFGNNILGCCIDFFQGITGADQHIVKVSNTIAVGDCVLIHLMATKRRTVKVESDALIHAILGSFINRQVASFKHITKGNGCNLPTDYSDTTAFLGFVLIVGLFGNGVDAGSKVIKLNLALAVGLYGFINTFTGNSEGDACNLTVFRSLYNLCAAKADCQLQITLYRVGNRLRVGDNILFRAAGTVGAICPGNYTHTLSILLGGSNHNGISRCFICGNDESVAADREIDTGHIGGKGILTKNTVGIGQLCYIFLTGPFHFNFLCSGTTLCKKAGQSRVVLNLRRNSVVIAHNLAIQGMTDADRIKNCIIAASADLIEVAVTLTDDGFPNDQLCSYCVSQFICTLVLRSPVRRNRAGVTILQNTTDKGFDFIGTDGAIQMGRVIIPEVLIMAGQYIANILTNAGFDAIGNVSLKGVQSTYCRVLGVSKGPTVHQTELRMTPITAIVFIAIARIADHIYFCLFTGSKCRGTKTEQCRKTHQQCQKERCAFLERFLFH